MSTAELQDQADLEIGDLPAFRAFRYCRNILPVGILLSRGCPIDYLCRGYHHLVRLLDPVDNRRQVESH